MTGINNITKKIIDDARAEADKIIAKANSQADAKRSETDAAIQQMRDEIMSEAQVTARDRAQRVIAAQELQTRKMMLDVKQSLIEQCFEAAARKLAKMPNAEYDALIKKMSKGLDGEVTHIARDAKKGCGGGFVLNRGNVSFNYSFDALLKNGREKAEKGVVDILFG